MLKFPLDVSTLLTQSAQLIKRTVNLLIAEAKATFLNRYLLFFDGGRNNAKQRDLPPYPDNGRGFYRGASRCETVDAGTYSDICGPRRTLACNAESRSHADSS